ncbi:MAG: hypothetical protein A2Y80_01610 [Deltaproteobacteria bacterium RBG_13_58_19]|nr:MAG: hypothetical protein A2Y80_01610 [Deltaproteobacteria bacterium RBG_13_58_19]
MPLTESTSWPGWKFFSSLLILGLLTKVAISGLFFSPPANLPGAGPRVSEAATQEPGAAPRLVALLEKERHAVQTREAALSAKDEQLRLLKREVEERLHELKAMQSQVLEFLEDEKRMQGEHNRHLVTTLEAMPPERAGKLLEKMDEEVAVQLLRRIKGKEAGAILGLLPPDKAAKLSNKLIR